VKDKEKIMINNESSPKNSPIDFPSALARIGNDEEFLAELLSLFKMDYETKMASLKNAITQEDFVSIQELGHSLKGASANLSLTFIQQAAYDLENAGKDRNIDKAKNALSTMGQEFQNLQEYLASTSQSL
jgi:HPt (histidine-containing phosphotransfer) domain-containing protein